MARSAAALAVGAALVALLVVVSTDEGASWARRLAMWAALLPAAGAIGAASATALARGRGELRALGALGVEPGRACRGAAVGGGLVAFVGPALAATGRADLAALFPRPDAPRAWSIDGAAAVREATLGLRLAADGALSLEPARAAAPSAAGPAALAVVLALAVGALAFPLWASRWLDAARAALVGAGAVLLSLGAFHAVAAGLAPAAALFAAPALLLVDAVVSSAARSSP
jgi:hypothetical protein